MISAEDHSGSYLPPEQTPQTIDFDGGAFTIPYLATDPEGFKVTTTHTLSRREGQTGSIFSPDEANRLKQAMQGEIKFQGGAYVHQARLALRQAQAEGVSEEEVQDLTNVFERTRHRYIRGMAGKVGIRNVGVADNVLSVDVKQVAFPMYTEFSDPNNSAEVLDASTLTGTAMAVRTTDRRLIIQHRAVAKQRLDAETLTRGNQVYSDIPGASVAGLLDATIDSKDRITGKPDPVDTDSVRAAILKEAEEELGTGLNDFDKLRIVGLAHDNVQVHDEFLILTDARISSDQLKEKSRNAGRNRHLGDADFEERLVDIEAVPEAIETLLCDAKCPLPPTHAALMVASGYSMVLQTQGPEAADDWKHRIEVSIRENYRQIDERVSEFYQRHPGALTRVPERYWDKAVPARNPHGYSPMYTPEEQGLPSFEDEMVRTGLLPETRRKVPTAFLFDVDGPLTDPQEHKVTETELLDIVAEKLDSGVPVGLNTGRAVDWTIERFVDLMKPHLKSPASITNLIVIGEMGGTWATFDETGEARHNKSKQLTVPEGLKEAIRKLIEEKYSDMMFFDDDRESMMSVIMNEGCDLQEFDKRRIELAAEIEALVSQSPEASRLKIGQTTLATDINVKYAGKDLGAERFQEWLRAKQLKSEHIVAFGDSASDVEMAEELDRKGERVTFVFVGPEPVTNGRTNGYRIINRPGYSKAALAILKDSTYEE